ncbi:zinc finger protein [Plasmodium brasilianum]|uniref:Zinc finger protein n=1 Tax=Plasmodium brasilianum TaxID=5824 RepID=A0ACB9Y5F2_PLABR|nr:zinc finger protein [Plasmodium brasilianum]
MHNMLRVETKTWTRDSHDLFDYEAQQVNKKSFLISTPIKLFRSKAQVSCVADNPQCLPNTAQDYLLSVRPEEDKYVISPAEHSLSNQYNVKKLWIIVKDLPEKFYALHENDIIKLGRFRLKVRQFIESVDTLNSLKLDDCPSKKCEAILDSSNIQCRICLIEGNQENDPLICPCDCKGSIKYAHLMCLRKWINGRLNLNDQLFSGSVFIKDICCELCKSKYPKSIKQNDELVQLVKIPNLKTPLIVLDNIIGQTSKGVHLISFADKKYLKLGRGHESDVRIPDVSISRYHATIKYEKGLFKLEDHNSKFGTLVALRKAREICPKDTMSLQVGRSVVNFRVDEEIPFKSGTIDIIENKEVIDSSEIANNEKSNTNITQINNTNLEENNRNAYEGNQFVDLTNTTNTMQNSYVSYRVDNFVSLLNYQNEYRIFGLRNCYNLMENGNNNNNEQNLVQLNCSGNNMNIEGIQDDLDMNSNENCNGNCNGNSNSNNNNVNNDIKINDSMNAQIVVRNNNQNIQENNEEDENNNNNDNNDENNNDEEGDDDDENNASGNNNNNNNNNSSNNNGNNESNDSCNNGHNNNSDRNDNDNNSNDSSNQNNSTYNSNGNNDTYSNSNGNKKNNSSSYNNSSNSSNGSSSSNNSYNNKICSSNYDSPIENNKFLKHTNENCSNMYHNENISRYNRNDSGNYCKNNDKDTSYNGRKNEYIRNSCNTFCDKALSALNSHDNLNFINRNNYINYEKMNIEDNFFFRNEWKTPQLTDFCTNNDILNNNFIFNCNTSLEKMYDSVNNSSYQKEFNENVFPYSYYHFNKNEGETINGILYNQANYNDTYYTGDMNLTNNKHTAYNDPSKMRKKIVGIESNSLKDISDINNEENLNDSLTKIQNSSSMNGYSLNYENCMVNKYKYSKSFMYSTKDSLHNADEVNGTKLDGCDSNDHNNSSSSSSNSSSNERESNSNRSREKMSVTKKLSISCGNNNAPLINNYTVDACELKEQHMLKNKTKMINSNNKNIMLDLYDKKNVRHKKLKKCMNNDNAERPFIVENMYQNNNTLSLCKDGNMMPSSIISKDQNYVYKNQHNVSKYIKGNLMRNKVSCTNFFNVPFHRNNLNDEYLNYYLKKKYYSEESFYKEKLYYESPQEYKCDRGRNSYSRMKNINDSSGGDNNNGSSNSSDKISAKISGNINSSSSSSRYKFNHKYYSQSVETHKPYNVFNFNDKLSVNRNNPYVLINSVSCVDKKFNYNYRGGIPNFNVGSDFVLNSYCSNGNLAYFDVPCLLHNSNYANKKNQSFLNLQKDKDNYNNNSNTGGSSNYNPKYNDKCGSSSNNNTISNSTTNNTSTSNHNNSNNDINSNSSNYSNNNNGYSNSNSNTNSNTNSNIDSCSRNYGEYITESSKNEINIYDFKEHNDIVKQYHCANDNNMKEYNLPFEKKHKDYFLRNNRRNKSYYDAYTSYATNDINAFIHNYSYSDENCNNNNTIINIKNMELTTKNKKKYCNNNINLADLCNCSELNKSFYDTQFYKKFTSRIKKNEDNRSGKINKGYCESMNMSNDSSDYNRRKRNSTNKKNSIINRGSGNSRRSSRNIHKIKNDKMLIIKNDRSYRSDGSINCDDGNKRDSCENILNIKHSTSGNVNSVRNNNSEEEISLNANGTYDDLGNIYETTGNSNDSERDEITFDSVLEHAEIPITHRNKETPNGIMYFHKCNGSNLSSHSNTSLNVMGNKKSNAKSHKIKRNTIR